MSWLSKAARGVGKGLRGIGKVAKKVGGALFPGAGGPGAPQGPYPMSGAAAPPGGGAPPMGVGFDVNNMMAGRGGGMDGRAMPGGFDMSRFGAKEPKDEQGWGGKLGGGIGKVAGWMGDHPEVLEAAGGFLNKRQENRTDNRALALAEEKAEYEKSQEKLLRDMILSGAWRSNV